MQILLVVAALSGFGATGARAGEPSYDIVAQATGGLLAMTGFPDGPPVRGGGALGDFVGGLYLALGVVALTTILCSKRHTSRDPSTPAASSATSPPPERRRTARRPPKR